MRRRRTAISRPKHNTWRYRFSMPNRVWTFGLRPAQFVILACVYFQIAHGELGTTPDKERIARTVHMPMKKVAKQITALVQKKLITRELYPVLPQKPKKKFFTLPDEVFLLRLSPTALAIYACLLCMEDRKTHSCCPSYRTIGKKIGVGSVNTIRKYVTELVEKGLIAVTPTTIWDKNGHARNGTLRYRILPICVAKDLFYAGQLES